jgi:hypothetical protein
MGIYLAAMQAHSNVKQILSQVRLSVSATTARAAMCSITEASLTALKSSVAEGREHNEVRCCTVIDNI